MSTHNFSPGELVRILNVPDQPGWIRDLAGQVGLVVEIRSNSGYYSGIIVMIDGTPHPGFHHLDLERVQ